jgi:hypothetical protein
MDKKVTPAMAHVRAHGPAPHGQKAFALVAAPGTGGAGHSNAALLPSPPHTRSIFIILSLI